jgi:hypothetical protein
VAPPISTAGERPASDDTVDVEELTLAESPEVQRQLEQIIWSRISWGGCMTGGDHD